MSLREKLERLSSLKEGLILFKGPPSLSALAVSLASLAPSALVLIPSQSYMGVAHALSDDAVLAVYEHYSELVTLLLRGFREGRDVVVVYPNDVLVNLGSFERSARAAVTISWLCHRLAHAAHALYIMFVYKSMFTGEIPYKNFLEPWSDVVIGYEHVRGKWIFSLERPVKAVCTGDREEWECTKL